MQAIMCDFRSAITNSYRRRFDEKVQFKENEAVLLQWWLQLCMCVYSAHCPVASDGFGDDRSTENLH